MHKNNSGFLRAIYHGSVAVGELDNLISQEEFMSPQSSVRISWYVEPGVVSIVLHSGEGRRSKDSKMSKHGIGERVKAETGLKDRIQ